MALMVKQKAPTELPRRGHGHSSTSGQDVLKTAMNLTHTEHIRTGAAGTLRISHLQVSLYTTSWPSTNCNRGAYALRPYRKSEVYGKVLRNLRPKETQSSTQKLSQAADS